MSLKIGITGGIGSGKTTVCKIFESLGVPVYRADERSRTISDRDETVIAAIKSTFGNDMYPNGKLDRQKMASVVFNDPAALEKLNTIIHPAVRNEFIAWVEKHTDYPYLIEEAAILFESGASALMDKTILVASPLKSRVERVMQRDNINEADVMARIKNQWAEEQKLEKADFAVWNDANVPLLEQVLALDKLFRKA